MRGIRYLQLEGRALSLASSAHRKPSAGAGGGPENRSGRLGASPESGLRRLSKPRLMEAIILRGRLAIIFCTKSTMRGETHLLKSVYWK